MFKIFVTGPDLPPVDRLDTFREGFQEMAPLENTTRVITNGGHHALGFGSLGHIPIIPVYRDLPGFGGQLSRAVHYRPQYRQFLRTSLAPRPLGIPRWFRTLRPQESCEIQIPRPRRLPQCFISLNRNHGYRKNERKVVLCFPATLSGIGYTVHRTLSALCLAALGPC